MLNLASSGNPWQMKFQNSYYLLQLFRGLFISSQAYTTTEQDLHTVGSAESNATFSWSCMRKGWGKAGNSSLTVLCSQLDCSLPYPSSSEELQCSCLVFLNPCIRGLYKSSVSFLFRGSISPACHTCGTWLCVVSVKIMFINAVILLS